jgi:hypothetical protein
MARKQIVDLAFLHKFYIAGVPDRSLGFRPFIKKRAKNY